MTKIVCISDIHGDLLDNLPEGDLLIIAGDLCPVYNHQIWFQQIWVLDIFDAWCKNLKKDGKFKEVIAIAGNHDFYFQKQPDHFRNQKVNFQYLEDNYCHFNDLKIYGSPWQPWFYDWAFNLYEPDLKKKWEKIPNDTDILVVHGPPHGYGDKAPRIITGENEEEWPGFEHTGSPSLLEKFLEIKAKYLICGHIHREHGWYEVNENKIVINASVKNEKYEVAYEPFLIEV